VRWAGNSAILQRYCGLRACRIHPLWSKLTLSNTVDQEDNQWFPNKTQFRTSSERFTQVPYYLNNCPTTIEPLPPFWTTGGCKFHESFSQYGMYHERLWELDSFSSITSCESLAVRERYQKMGGVEVLLLSKLLQWFSNLYVDGCSQCLVFAIPHFWEHGKVHQHARQRWGPSFPNLHVCRLIIGLE
jgi:hypothetical protein